MGENIALSLKAYIFKIQISVYLMTFFFLIQGGLNEQSDSLLGLSVLYSITCGQSWFIVFIVCLLLFISVHVIPFIMYYSPHHIVPSFNLPVMIL